MAQIGSKFVVLGPQRRLVPNKIVSKEDKLPPAVRQPVPESEKPVAFGRRGATQRSTQSRKSAGGLLGIFGFGRRGPEDRSRGR